MKIYYYDNAATTSMPCEIADKMREINIENYYNPMGLTFASFSAKKELDIARKTIADYFHVASNTIYFCGSGTESDNLAFLGTRRRKGGNVVLSTVEHSAIYKSACELKRQGYDVRFCTVTSGGAIQEDKLLSLIDVNTTLVSIIHASNETGAINDICRLSKLCKDINPSLFFHSDGVQAIGKLPINLQSSSIDLYSFNAHKIGGSKGVGGLYIKDGVKIANLIFGGNQEKSLRPGTENVAAIVSMSSALTYYVEHIKSVDMVQIKSQLIEILKSRLDSDILIISPENSMSNILYFSLKNVNGETILHLLEERGIIVGIGSACSSGSKDNRMALALGLSKEFSSGVIRLSMGLTNDISDVAFVSEAIISAYIQLVANATVK